MNEFMSSLTLGQLKKIAQERGLHFDGSLPKDTLTQRLVSDITNSATDQELERFENQAALVRPGSITAEQRKAIGQPDLTEKLKESIRQAKTKKAKSTD